jgi:hypothetical protein
VDDVIAEINATMQDIMCIMYPIYPWTHTMF